MALDWVETTLGAEVDFLTGYPFKSDRYTSGCNSIRLVRGDNIVQGAMRWDGVKRWPLSESKEYDLYQLREGDVVLAMDRPWIEAGLKFAAISEYDLPCLLVQRTARLRGGPRLDTGFLRYLIASKEFTQHIHAITTGTAVPHISGSQIKDFGFKLPPLPEQKRIAHILGTLDEKIELNRRMNATLEAMARALFQSWFVDFDPVRAKMDGRKPEGMDDGTASLFPKSFQNSPLGDIPQGWEVRKLRDLTSKIGSGSTPRGGAEVYVEEGTALIRSQNVYDNDFRWEGLVRIPSRNAVSMRGVEVMRNDVLLNITGDSILRTCVVDPWALPARVNQHVAIIRANQAMTSRYLHLYLGQDSIKSLLIAMSAGATRHAITKRHLEDVNVLTPCDKVLDAFHSITLPWFTKIEVNRHRSRTLQALRDAQMPGLLTAR